MERMLPHTSAAPMCNSNERRVAKIPGRLRLSWFRDVFRSRALRATLGWALVGAIPPAALWLLAI